MPVHAIQPLDYDRVTGPATLVFAETLARRNRLTQIVAGAGGRLAALQKPHVMPGILAGWAGAAVVVLDLVGNDGAAIDPLLALIQHGVAAARFESVVIFGDDQIDMVTARIDDPRVTLLVDPDETALAAVMAQVLAPRTGIVAEPSSEDESRRLAALSEEVARIARVLAALSGEGDDPPDETIDDPQAALTMTRALLRLRRLRDRFFDRTLFADPAWDMLLDLFAARLERRRVAVSSLCIAAAVPPTTALRWIAALTAHGLIAREPDPQDGRRAFVALTEAAATAMGRYMASALRHVRPATA